MESLEELLTQDELDNLNLTGNYVPLLPAAEVDEDAYTKDLMVHYMLGLGGMTICVLGVIGNILSLFVLSRKSMCSSTYSYLSALSVCDSLFLICTAILLVKDVDKPERNVTYADQGIYPHLFPFVHPLAFTFQVTSIWLTLAFTVDRYIMICHPFRAEPFCTISRARKVVAAMVVSSVIFNLPKFFEYRTGLQEVTLGQLTPVVELTPLGQHHVFKQLYHGGFYIVFVCGLPFLTLAVCNAFLIHAVRLSRKRGREINAADRKRNDTTIMLIGVVVVFFICQMPALVSRTIWAALEDSYFEELPLFTLNEISNFLIVLNSAINILPYYFFGQRFRREFWHLFCRCLLKYKSVQALTRSFSLTQLDDNNRSRNQSVVSANLKLGTINNGGLLRERLAAENAYPSPPSYHMATEKSPQNGVKNGSQQHLQCPLLDNQTARTCSCDASF